MTGDMAEAVAAARTAGAHLSDAAAALKRLSTALECPLQTPSKGPDIIATHRREHRMGVPAKVASDPEPEAFVRARTDTLTFPRIAAEVARAVPPGTAAQAGHPPTAGATGTGPNRDPQSADISQYQPIPAMGYRQTI